MVAIACYAAATVELVAARTPSIGEDRIVAARYRLGTLLGRGGMGEVWEAVHLVTGATFAVKILRAADADRGARALREARAASAIGHPNVVTIHDVFEEVVEEVVEGVAIRHRVACLVMERLHGESLGARLRRRGALEVDESTRIVRALLEALAAAHALGVVHRDVKPDNVFLLDDGRIKVLDFGVAKLTASAGPIAETRPLTATGAILGTPQYMPPEQAFGDHEVDPRADLWAAGVVLYECLSGARPIDGDHVGRILRDLATGALVPLAKRRPDLPAELLALVDRLLSIDRDRRPRSAEEVVAAIDALGSRPRRSRVVLAAVALATVALAIAIGGVRRVVDARERPREPALLASPAPESAPERAPEGMPERASASATPSAGAELEAESPASRVAPTVTTSGAVRARAARPAATTAESVAPTASIGASKLLTEPPF